MSIDDVLSWVAEGARPRFKAPKSPAGPCAIPAAEQSEGDSVCPLVQETKAPRAIAMPPRDTIPSTTIHLPRGVRLISQSSVRCPSAQAPWLRITDVGKFIGAQLADLDARLNSPVQIRGGGSVFEILKTLAEFGLELAIERPDVESRGEVSPALLGGPKQKPE